MLTLLSLNKLSKRTTGEFKMTYFITALNNSGLIVSETQTTDFKIASMTIKYYEQQKFDVKVNEEK